VRINMMEANKIQGMMGLEIATEWHSIPCCTAVQQSKTRFFA
jgi:hypothetical protein